MEHLANLYYPTEAKGKINGSVLATIEISPDGTVDSIKIDRSSGHQVLDDAVRKIVMLGSPYAHFSPEMRQDVDVLEITRLFVFTRGEGTMLIRPREALPQKRAKQ